MRVTCTAPIALGASELHDFLNCHHSPNGEGIHIPVGDISQVESCKGRLKEPRSCLLNLLHYTVDPEERRSANLLYFVGFSHNCITIIFRQRPTCMVDVVGVCIQPALFAGTGHLLDRPIGERWLINNLIQNEMVFWNPRSFLLVVETNRLK